MMIYSQVLNLLDKEEGINVEIERLGTIQTHHHGFSGSFAQVHTIHGNLNYRIIMLC
jgi:hypothetical protein